jgi:alpha-D-xyloside xylohydrolase
VSSWSPAAGAAGNPTARAQAPAVDAAQSASEAAARSLDSAGQTDGTSASACGGATVVVTSDAWQIHLNRGTGELTVTGPSLDGAAQGTAIHFAAPRVELAGTWHTLGRVLACQGLGQVVEVTQDLAGHPVLALLSAPSPEVVRYEVLDWGGVLPERTLLTAFSGPDENFYGFGERFDSLNQTGRVVQTLTLDAFGPKGDRSYAVAPWFMSTRGYGFHLDSSAESTFDMRATASDRYVVTNLDSTLRFNVVGGPSLVDVLQRYTGYTGRPALPPPWVFAPWMSSDVWRTGGEVRYVVTKLAERGIPGSVFVFDSPWETAYNDFHWNMTQFGLAGTYEGQTWAGFTSSRQMMEFLRAHGYRAVVWMTPFLDTRSLPEGIPGQNLGRAADYDAAAAAGDFVRSAAGGPPLLVSWWKGEGSPLDFTHPATRSWLAEQLQRLIADSGGVISGIKTDDGESDFIPLHALYSDGRTGVEMRNGYVFEYLRAVYGAMGDPAVLFARSGFTGTQAFSVLWAGDNEPNFGEQNGLPSVIVAGQSAAMSGYSLWGHDIGGYEDSNAFVPADDLFMRWTQFGALSPIMQMHRKVQRGLQYPWSYGTAALENYRASARLHISLFPYLYSYATVAAETGVPLIRPLVLMNQSDPNTYWLEHTYLLGNELLVAPIFVGGSTQRYVYLPRGGWYDYWTNRRFVGGRSVTWSGARSQLPLFVREGAILPLISPDVQTLVDASYTGPTSLVLMTTALDFMVYPAGASQFSLYDGSSVSCQASSGSIGLTLVSTARRVRFRILQGHRPSSVTLNGLVLPERTNLDAVSSGWAQTGDFITVKFSHPGGTSRVNLH